MNQQKKIIALLIVFGAILTSCHKNEIGNFVDNDANNEPCIGSFKDYAYDESSRSRNLAEKTNKYVNPAWLFESNVPDEFQIDIKESTISGERLRENELELWIRSRRPLFYVSEDSLFNNYILIYNTSSKEWSRISASVKNCDCIADELFFDSAGNIWAKNAGNSGNDGIGCSPVLSKFNFSLNVFEPIEITNHIYSGSLGEQYEKIYYSEVLYDGKDSIWIFNHEGDAFIFDVIKETIAPIDLLKDMKIGAITYDQRNEVFFLIHQKSTKLNFLRIPSDFEIVKFFPLNNQIEIIRDHPFYWPLHANLWIDQNGSLWFDTIGYLNSDQKWHLLMPNIGSFIFNAYIDKNLNYVPQNIIAETSDGKLWFEGRGGIAWRSIYDLDGCWDSIYEDDVYEDGNKEIWLINREALYRREKNNYSGQ